MRRTTTVRLAAAVLLALALLTVRLGGGMPALADTNCSDYQYQEDAQAYFDANGGSPTNNVDGLDRDHDGIACEDLPSNGGAGNGGGAGDGAGSGADSGTGTGTDSGTGTGTGTGDTGGTDTGAASGAGGADPVTLPSTGAGIATGSSMGADEALLGAAIAELGLAIGARRRHA